MTLEEIKSDITSELAIELKNEEGFDRDILEVKVKGAIREVKAARKYPSSYSEAMIEADMTGYYTQIKAIALYDYVKIGAEGQNNYSADGENIQYSDRNELFYGILPIARV